MAQRWEGGTKKGSDATGLGDRGETPRRTGGAGITRELRTTLLTLQAWRICCPVQPNVRANRAPTVGRQARAGENVPCTARPGLVARRWCSG
jgi:hypothetical protein